MPSSYSFTLAIWPPLAATAFLAAIGLYSWRRRDVPAARWLAVCSVITILWLLGIAYEAAAVSPATKIAWRKFQSLCQAPAMTAVTCFVLEYAYPGRWLTRRNLTGLWIPALVASSLVVVDGGDLLWRSAQVSPSGDVVFQRTGLGFLVVAYGAGLILINLVALAWLFIRSPQHRWPAALMILTQTVARSLYLLNLITPSASTSVDLDVLTIVLAWTVYAIALFGFRIFDPLPAARRAVMEQMHAAALVFDDRWRVMHINPAAEAVLGMADSAARGRAWSQAIPSQGELTRLHNLLRDQTHTDLVATSELPDVKLGSGSDARHYTLALTPLNDARGLLLGYLLMLRDVSDQRRAQAQLLEHRWAQATLQEREQLAHELHDGLSQDLAFLNVQAQAVQLYIETQQDDAARITLARLAEVAREMHGDVRDLIGNLLEVSLPSAGFCAALRQVAERYQERTGVPVSLAIDDSTGALADPGLLPADTGVQLLRITQEALSNVRKHAGADQVRLEVQACNGQLELAVVDNGAGFQVDAPGAPWKHFGLQVMHQRAERVGGHLIVQSAPGQGTRVEVCVPLEAAEGEIAA